MSRLRKFLAVSFRAKVLVPVIFVMICLFVITTLDAVLLLVHMGLF